MEMTGFQTAFAAPPTHNSHAQWPFPIEMFGSEKSLGAKMEKYNKDQDALGKQLGTFARDWKRIGRELDDVAVHWEVMAEKLLPNYSITPCQSAPCTQMKGNAAGRGFSVYFVPFLLDEKLYGQIVVKADSTNGETPVDAARFLIGTGGAFYDQDGTLLHGEQDSSRRYVVLCNLFTNVLAAPL